MTAQAVDEKLEELKRLAAGLGVREGIDPFMTLAFVSLPVIPALRLNTCGLIDVERQEILEVSFGETQFGNEKVGGKLYGSGENISPERK